MFLRPVDRCGNGQDHRQLLLIVHLWIQRNGKDSRRNGGSDREFFRSMSKSGVRRKKRQRTRIVNSCRDSPSGEGRLNGLTILQLDDEQVINAFRVFGGGLNGGD